MKAAFCLSTIVATLIAGSQFHWEANRAQELHLKQSISASRLDPVKRRALVKAIDARHVVKRALATRIKEIDLNGDGALEVIAQGVDDEACGATGNCPFWAFRWEEGRYTLLLESQAQTFTVQPTSTRGFHDLVLGVHESATMAGLDEYKFDGKVYRRAKCYEASWTYYDEHRKLHQLKKPLITLCGKDDQPK